MRTSVFSGRSVISVIKTKKTLAALVELGVLAVKINGLSSTVHGHEVKEKGGGERE